MLTRRTFLLGGACVAGGLLVGWTVLPPRQRLTGSTPLPTQGSQVALNGWVKIAADSSVTVMMCKAEMGQGIHTGLAMLLAEELDADWSQVRVEEAPIDKIYNAVQSIVDDLPFRPDDDSYFKQAVVWVTRKGAREFGTMMTGGSSSMNDLWTPMREAGASARAMLVSAAAGQWGVPPGECRVEKGYVLHERGHKASFGELVTGAARQPLPRKVVLKRCADFKLIGQPVRRIEAASKINGTARFGIDVLPTGLLYASVVMCPVLGGTVAHFDVTPARKMPGFIKAFAVAPYAGGTGAVAVIADNPYRAMNAVTAIKVDWHNGAAASVSSHDAEQRIIDALDDTDGYVYFHRGHIDTAMSHAARKIEAVYYVPYLAHGAVEPLNCTAQVGNGAATIWVSTQVPALARQHVAKALDIDADQVDVQTQLLGGAFGRRLELDFIAQAAMIAREADGRPVQTIWSRAQDFTHDFYRPACAARLEAGFDEHGKLVAWHAKSARAGIACALLRRAAHSDRQDHLRRRVRSTVRMAGCECVAQDRRVAGADRLLALGRPFAPGVLHRELYRRSRGRCRSGSDCISRGAARAASAALGGSEACRDVIGLGKPAQARSRRRAMRAWRRVARGLRQRCRAGRRGVDRAESADSRASRGVRDRLRLAGESESDSSADGGWHCVRSVQRVAERDHDRQRRGSAAEFRGISGRSYGRVSRDRNRHHAESAASARCRRTGRAADCAGGGQCGVRADRAAFAQIAVVARVQG
jgi:hypothetical protein